MNTYQVCKGCHCPYKDDNNNEIPCVCGKAGEYCPIDGSDLCWECHCKFCGDNYSTNRLRYGHICWDCKNVHELK